MPRNTKGYGAPRKPGEAAKSLTLSQEAEAIIRRKASSLIARELRSKSRNPGRVRRVFTNAFTGEGMISLPETQAALAQRRIGLHGICGGEHAYLSAATECAIARGWDVVVSPSPLQPDLIAHLYIPEYSARSVLLPVNPQDIGNLSF